MEKVKRVVVWFRKDLRLNDNEALTEALNKGDEVYPVYIFDHEELNGKSLYNFSKTGPFRLKFILESITELKLSLQNHGIDLIVREGNPEEEIFNIVQELNAKEVFANMERTPDEVNIQEKLEKKLWSIGSEISYYRGKMLYYTQDLPYPIHHTPNTFINFRKSVEKIIQIRPPLKAPENFPCWTVDIEKGDIPSIDHFGYDDFTKDDRLELEFTGGEIKALDRLKTYFGKSRYPDNFDDDKNKLRGKNISSRLSPWLAIGCVSPKQVYKALKEYENYYGISKSSQNFFLELLWRDYFRLMGKKYGSRIFEKGGIRGLEINNDENDCDKFHSWVESKTENNLINACMNQLKYTGFLSHKGRQLVSSYLVYDMKVSWWKGASYFQHISIDYDICSNWVNWNVVGGVGPDNRENSYINVEKQIKKLDPENKYINLWLNL